MEQKQYIKPRNLSRQNSMTTSQKIRKIKHTIQQFQTQLRKFQIQLQQKINISKRLRYQRN